MAAGCHVIKSRRNGIDHFGGTCQPRWVSKNESLAGLSVAAALVIQFTPVPDRWKTIISISGGILFILFFVRILLSRKHAIDDGGESRIRVSTREANDVVIAENGSVASKISTGSGSIYGHVAGRDIIFHHSPPAPKPDIPHILAKLRVLLLEDSKWIRIRFELTNGDQKAEDIRIAFAATQSMYHEFQSVAGELAPHEELDTFYVHVARTEDDNDFVQLSIYFSATVDTERKDFVAEHIFPITADSLVAGTLVKSARNRYREGNSPDPADLVSTSIVKVSFGTHWQYTGDTA